MHRKIYRAITLAVTVVYVVLHVLDAFHITNSNVDHAWPPIAALLLCFVYFSVTEALEEMEKLGERYTLIEGLVKKQKLEGFRDFFRTMRDAPKHPLGKLQAEHGMRIVEQLSEALESDDISIDSLEDFCTLYVETMNNAKPGAKFYATSLPYVRYFWRPANMESIRDAMLKNQRKGGTMERIFILKDEAELKTTEVREVIEGQMAFGVKSHYCFRSTVDPRDYRELFLLCKNWRKGPDGQDQCIAWRLWVDPVSDTFLRARATNNPEEVDKLMRHYVGIKKAHSHEYIPAALQLLPAGGETGPETDG